MKARKRVISSAMYLIVILTGLLFHAPPLLATGPWQQIPGPYGGPIHALSVDSSNSQIVYAGTNGGVFKTNNGGTSWVAINAGLDEEIVNTIAMNPGSSQTVYAGTDSGVFKTIDGGTTWAIVFGKHLYITVNSIAVDPNNGQVVYAGTDEGFFKTIDGGANWTAMDSLPASRITSIVVDHTNSNIFYAAMFDSNGGRIFKTTDGGTTWTAVKTGLRDCFKLIIDPSSSQTVYAAAGGGIFKTVDGGATWTNIKVLNAVQSLAIDPMNGQTLYAGSAEVTHADIYKSSNGGATWALVNTTTDYRADVGAMVIVPGGETVYAGTYFGVLKTNNGGATWAATNSGLVATRIGSFAIDPVNDKNLYLGTDLGTFKTSDGGVTWSAMDGLAYFCDDLLIDPTNSRTVYAGAETVYKTNDGGVTWAVAGGKPRGVRKLVVDPFDSQTIYAGTTEGGLFKTTNGGSSWAAINNGLILPYNWVPSLAIDSSNSQIMYAGTYSGAFKTTNGGATWNFTSNIFPNAFISALAVDPVEPQTIYAGSSDGLFKSTDGGETWVAINNGLIDCYIGSLAIDPNNHLVLYAGSTRVHKSYNGGITWRDASNGVLNYPIRLLTFDINGKFIYAGTSGGGLFRAENTPDVPTAPVNINATAGDGQATVTFNAPVDDGGSAVTGYTVTSYPGNRTATGTSSPITVTGLASGTAYTFTVVATNIAGASSASAKSNSVTPCRPPGVPTAVTAIPGDRQATVSFTAPSDNGGSVITGYIVTTFPGNTTTKGTASPIVVSGLTAGTAYTFSVVATNAAGNSVPSAASNSVVPATVPGSPTEVSAYAANGSVTVNFTAPSDDGGSTVTGYMVTATPGGISATGTASPIAISGLANGTSYTFAVVAINAMGNSTPSDPSPSVVPCAVPTSPVIISASPGNAQAMISFVPPPTDNGCPVTGYTVTASPGQITATGIASPIAISGLTNGTKYTFTVVATNAMGNSTPSDASPSVVPCSVPASPVIISASPGNGHVMLSFAPPPTDNGSPITGYTVTASPGQITATGASSPITISGLTNGTAYTFTVVASNAVGNSPPTAPSDSVMPMQPFTVTPTAGTGGSMSPATAQTVSYGRTTSFSITPSNGYILDSVNGCGGALIDSTYTTGPITGDCTVTASFQSWKKDGIIAPRSGKASPDIGDALAVLRHVVGLASLSPDLQLHADVAPLNMNELPQGDGKVDIADVIMILRRAIGVGTW